MASNLAVFFDGTWNEPNDATNVYELYKAVIQTDDQQARYIEGVGTQGRGLWAAIDKFVGGAFGAGLSANIREGYQWLSERFQPGDRVFLFGFSRGAYTARSLAGMIRNAGMVVDPTPDMVEEAYSLYRDESAPGSDLAKQFRSRFSRETDIHFVGVWDTVGSLGIPVGTLKIPGFSSFYRFHDTELSNHVSHAYHAIATNEFREPYTPTYWTRNAGQARPAGLPVEQRWFLGAHADVGGGYDNGRLQTLPAAWLQRKAARCGLRFHYDLNVPPDYDAAEPRDSYKEFTEKVPLPIQKVARTWSDTALNLTCDPRLEQRLRANPALLENFPELRQKILALTIAGDAL